MERKGETEIIIIIIINRVLQYSGSKAKWVVVNE